MPGDIRGLVSDPAFLQLSDDEKRSILARAGAPEGFADAYLKTLPGAESSEPAGPPTPDISIAPGTRVKQFAQGASEQVRAGALSVGKMAKSAGDWVAQELGPILGAKPKPDVAARRDQLNQHLDEVLGSVLPKEGEPTAKRAGRLAEQVGEMTLVGGAQGAGKLALPAAVAAVAGGEGGAALGRATGIPGAETVGGLGGAVVGGAAVSGLANKMQVASARASARPPETPVPPPTPTPKPPTAPTTGGLLSRFLGPSLAEEVSSLGWNLLGRKLGGLTGVPSAPLVGGRIGTVLHRMLNRAEAAVERGAGRGAAAVAPTGPTVDEAAVQQVMKYMRVPRDRAIEIVQASEIKPAVTRTAAPVARPAPAPETPTAPPVPPAPPAAPPASPAVTGEAPGAPLAAPPPAPAPAPMPPPRRMGLLSRLLRGTTEEPPPPPAQLPGPPEPPAAGAVAVVKPEAGGGEVTIPEAEAGAEGVDLGRRAFLRKAGAGVAGAAMPETVAKAVTSALSPEAAQVVAAAMNPETATEVSTVLGILSKLKEVNNALEAAGFQRYARGTGKIVGGASGVARETGTHLEMGHLDADSIMKMLESTGASPGENAASLGPAFIGSTTHRGTKIMEALRAAAKVTPDTAVASELNGLADRIMEGVGDNAYLSYRHIAGAEDVLRGVARGRDALARAEAAIAELRNQPDADKWLAMAREVMLHPELSEAAQGALLRAAGQEGYITGGPFTHGIHALSDYVKYPQEYMAADPGTLSKIQALVASLPKGRFKKVQIKTALGAVKGPYGELPAGRLLISGEASNATPSDIGKYGQWTVKTGPNSVRQYRGIIVDQDGKLMVAETHPVLEPVDEGMVPKALKKAKSKAGKAAKSVEDTINKEVVEPVKQAITAPVSEAPAGSTGESTTAPVDSASAASPPSIPAAAQPAGATPPTRVGGVIEMLPAPDNVEVRLVQGEGGQVHIIAKDTKTGPSVLVGTKDNIQDARQLADEVVSNPRAALNKPLEGGAREYVGNQGPTSEPAPTPDKGLVGEALAKQKQPPKERILKPKGKRQVLEGVKHETAIEMQPVESSAFSEAGYDEASQTLAMTHKRDGTTYRYRGVTPEEYQEALHGPAGYDPEKQGKWSVGKGLGALKTKYADTASKEGTAEIPAPAPDKGLVGEALAKTKPKTGPPYAVGDVLPDGRVVVEVDAKGNYTELRRPKGTGPKPPGKGYGD